MEIILERELEHQQKAVDALMSALEGVSIAKPRLSCENPAFDYNAPRLIYNISELQKEIRDDYHGCRDEGEYLNLDIKMETGTGKTYVYTKTIYEMHKRFGFNKFIIAVPSLAIKAGTSQFIADNYVRHHFSDVCGYNCEIELCVLESPKKKKKKGFLAMPATIRDFVIGSCQTTNKIYVLLVNMQLLTSGNMLTRNDYDYLVEGYYRPFDALRATKPIIIIDEPHRFSRDQKAYKAIVEELCPQMIIRFGATFPDITIGKVRNKSTQKDYNNLVYELNACDSFNLNLIKGVVKEHLNPQSHKKEKVKLLSVNSKTSATFQFIKNGENTRTYTLAHGDSLSIIDPAFDGITISAIGQNYIELTNGQIKNQGEEFNTDIYSSSYQEQMLKLAIQRHFETERQNFNRQFKIKTLALFFIDDISSYRESGNDKAPYLKEMFERLLLENINRLLSELPDTEKEYKEFLKASAADISACHAGYFSQDNSDSDESIALEVTDILHNKKKLLSLRNDDGTYNTRRFLFSKWTLKEGWDNPNVFTIAKLRSSGSENSRLQEVGRGLRLPVDENGNRISNEEFKLNYIVDFTEADFAQKLVDEINGDLPKVINIKLSTETLKRVALGRKTTSDLLFAELLIRGYVDGDKNIKLANRDSFFAEYPEFAECPELAASVTMGVSNNKISDANKVFKKTVRIRAEVYSELKELWEKINQKYYLFFDRDLTDEIPKALHEILRKPGIFGNITISSHRELIEADKNGVNVKEGTGVDYSIKKPLAYNTFLKTICSQTSIPIIDLHNAIRDFANDSTNKFSTDYINEYSAANIIAAFTDWRIERLQKRFRYSRSNQSVGATALSNNDGSPKEIIKQGNVGTKFITGIPSAKYLYDSIAFDSPLEKENIMTDIQEVVVYGKIPRASIAIPTIVGENYSPDFMYVVKRKDGTKVLNLVIETKCVDGDAELRRKEETKIECAEAFFKQLSNDGYAVSFDKQLSNKKVMQIIEDVIAK